MKTTTIKRFEEVFLHTSLLDPFFLSLNKYTVMYCGDVQEQEAEPANPTPAGLSSSDWPVANPA